MNRNYFLTLDNTAELRIGLFRILAVGGMIVSAVAGFINLVLGLPAISTWLCFGAALVALALYHYARKSGRYRLSMMLTIVLIFFVLFTVLFLFGGGYKSGMPIYFILAAVFTAFMLEGAWMYGFVAGEILWYTLLCVFAYLRPEDVYPFSSEGKMLTDIIIAMVVVAAALSATMYLQMQMNGRKQEELDLARKEALAASEAKTTFLANMSHDIRTPLNTVVSMNELIARRTVSEEIRGWTENIRISCDMLLSLIGDILDLSRIESGRAKLTEAPYLPAQLLKECETTWQDAAGRAGLSFVLRADEGLPSVLYGSLDSIRKIVNNLIGNAVKYTDTGEIRVSFSAEEMGEPDSAEKMILCIEVEDTGCGISESEMERIFLPFEQGTYTTKRGNEGTGLGLAIVKDLAEAMGGTISCQSEEGKGSRFAVRIPQSIRDPEPIGPRSSWSEIATKAEPFASIIAPDVKMLVVDDNEFNRQVMLSLLKPTLMLMDDVESGREALEMLEIRQYDLILMDIMMPEMDGIETLQKIREGHLADGTPVIALTADVLSGTKERLLAAGFDAYLGKPVSMQELGDLLVHYLHDRVTLVWDPAFRKLSESQRLVLTEKLQPFHIHLEDALELDGGALDNLRMRAEYFLDYQADVDALSEGKKDEDEIFHFVHALKSAAKSIGARDLAVFAAYMERHRGEEKLILRMIPVLQEEYAVVCEGEKWLLQQTGDD